MGTLSSLWLFSKRIATGGLIGLTISDRWFSFSPVKGFSMLPTLVPFTESSLSSLGGKLRPLDPWESPRPLSLILPALWSLTNVCLTSFMNWWMLHCLMGNWRRPPTGDVLLVEKLCLDKYRFSNGDVIILKYGCYCAPCVLLSIRFLISFFPYHC